VSKSETDRGVYRSIYVTLWDDPDFLTLSPEAKLVFYYLRTSPLSNMPCIYRFYREAIVEHTGLKDTVVNRVLDTLSQTKWIETEKGIVWVRHALKYDPSISLKNPKHVEAIKKVLNGLPKLQIVINFCTYYGIPIPYEIPSPIPYEIPYAIPGTGTGTGTGTGKYSMGGREKIPPDVEDVRAYCLERKNGISAEAFMAHYNSNGWKVGKNPMKDWKAAVITWEQKRKQEGNGNGHRPTGIANQVGKDTSGTWDNQPYPVDLVVTE
jgi:hypothetical protein